MSDKPKARPLFDPPIVRRAIVDSFIKLNPRHQLRNPVMFTVLIGSVLTTALGIQAVVSQGEESAKFIFAISFWLWFTVIFANFAEAMAEGRGKAQAATLRKAKTETMAKLLGGAERQKWQTVPAAKLKPGDIVLIPPNEKHMTRNTGTEPLVLLCFFAESDVTKGTTEFKSF